MYIVHYKLKIVYCIMYTINKTLYTVNRTLYTVQCTLYTAHCISIPSVAPNRQTSRRETRERWVKSRV